MSSKESKTQLILIDGNALLHRAFHAYPFLSTTKGEQVNAVYGFTLMLLQVLEKFNPKYIIVTFDKGKPTFRHQQFTQYKSTRKPMDKGLASQISRTYQVVEAFEIPIFAIEGYEADDLLGTLVRKAEKLDNIDEVLIVTGDRDLLQLLDDKVKAFMPGKSFGEGSVVDVAGFKEKYGLEPLQLIDYKALRGDASDNIPGVAGIGEKGATKLLQEFESLENLYAHLDQVDKKTKVKLEESAEMAFLSKKLATIDTDVPLQFDLIACETGKYDKEKVSALFEELEFKTLVKKMRGEVKINDQGTIINNQPNTKSKITNNKKNSNSQDVQQGELFVENPEVVVDEKEALRKYLEGQPENTVNLDVAMVDVLAHMREKGMLIDKEVLSSLSREFAQKLELLTQEIYAFAGHEFNINSSKQLATVLFDDLKLPVIKHTKTGRSTDEEVLTELSLTQPIAEKILEYRELYKLKSTYIDALPNYIKEDGRVHGTLHLDVAATGRLSSSDPNLQNIPVKGHWGNAIRSAFIVPPGYTLVSVDYSQIELRILAHLSGDPSMKEIFAEDRDIHASTAALIFNTSVDQITKDQRRSAKTINFGLMYGMGAHALAKDLKITFAQAQLFIKAYFEAFPYVKKWIDGVLKKGQEVGYVETVMGRRRYLPELQSPDKRLRSAGERMAINMPAQGTQSEMIKVAMVGIDKRISEGGKDQIFMLMQVHDELLFEVREDVVEKWVPVVKDLMQNAMTLSVPVKVGVNCGKSWGKLESLEE